MTTALTPALALDYVRELSADIVAGAVLDARGERLAGEEQLAQASRVLPDAAHVHGRTEHGQVFAARDDTHSIVVVTGPFALPRVTRHDLVTALSALGGQTRPHGPETALSEAAARAVLSAAQDAFRRPRAV